MWDDVYPDSVVARTHTVATRISVTITVAYIGENEGELGVSIPHIGVRYIAAASDNVDVL